MFSSLNTPRARNSFIQQVSSEFRISLAGETGFQVVGRSDASGYRNEAERHKARSRRCQIRWCQSSGFPGDGCLPGFSRCSEKRESRCVSHSRFENALRSSVAKTIS